jgi:hypothetical protein
MKRGFLLNTNKEEQHLLQLRGGISSNSHHHPFPSHDRVGLPFSRGPSPWSARLVVDTDNVSTSSSSSHGRRLNLRGTLPIQTKAKVVTAAATAAAAATNDISSSSSSQKWAKFYDVEEDVDMEEESKANWMPTTTCSPLDFSHILPTNTDGSQMSVMPSSQVYVIPARRQNSSSASHVPTTNSSSLIPKTISLLPPPPQFLPPPPPPTPLESLSMPTTTASTSQSTTTSQKNIGNSFLPTKTKDVPKAALSGWYGQKPRTHQLSKSQFVSWDDSGPPHRRRFTSLFVCPLTGEIFASGRFGSGGDGGGGGGGDQPNQQPQQVPFYHVSIDPQTGCEVVWYSKCIHFFLGLFVGMHSHYYCMFC